MVYNTRRKSLSLPSLGIHLPSSSRAHRSPPSKLPNTTNTTTTTTTKETAQQQQQQQPPPAKKIKRSHVSTASSPTRSSKPSPSAPSSPAASLSKQPKLGARSAYEHTPPPSPGATTDAKVDTEGINDEIVTGVIEQLEKTGNRPHLIKELAAVLSTTSESVAGSANPAALLSSRLATYLRRPWTALAPCPLAKELIPIHPRKVYFYLTNSPRQEIPASSDDILGCIRGGGKGGKRIISPSLSNASVDEDEEEEQRKREALSPSPEVDLSTPDLDENADDDMAPPTPAGSFSGRSSLARDGTNPSNEVRLVHNHRAASPPLEGDEREFTQTASSMRTRGMTLDDSVRPSTEKADHMDVEGSSASLEESAEVMEQRNIETAAALFGPTHANHHHMDAMVLSSPAARHTQLHIITEARKLHSADVEMQDQSSALGDARFGSGWDMRSPENVELDELDDMLGGF